MIKRTFDHESLYETMEPCLPIEGLDLPSWLASPLNVVLTDGEGNFSLFEKEEQKGIYTGHYFFRDRGKKALLRCKEMLREMFEGPYGAHVIRGQTPLRHKGALWMNKQLGFKQYGTLSYPQGEFAVVILTRSEWERDNL